MKRSEGRIFTTHTGSLPRTPEWIQLLVPQSQGEEIDPQTFEAQAQASTRRALQLQAVGAKGQIAKLVAGLLFLTELEHSAVQQISIEAAQPKLDLSVLSEFKTKTVILGVLDLNDLKIETPEGIAARIREALRYIPAERLMLARDCGMKYLPRQTAFRKLKAMCLAAAIVRESLE